MKNRMALTSSRDMNMQDVMSVCCGNPRGDELPQVGSEEDVVLDIYSDVLSMPREHAAVIFHHQYDDGLDYEEMIH